MCVVIKLLMPFFNILMPMQLVINLIIQARLKTLMSHFYSPSHASANHHHSYKTNSKRRISSMRSLVDLLFNNTIDVIGDEHKKSSKPIQSYSTLKVNENYSTQKVNENYSISQSKASTSNYMNLRHRQNSYCSTQQPSRPFDQSLKPNIHQKIEQKFNQMKKLNSNNRVQNYQKYEGVEDIYRDSLRGSKAHEGLGHRVEQIKRMNDRLKTTINDFFEERNQRQHNGDMEDTGYQNMRQKFSRKSKISEIGSISTGLRNKRLY